jgi:acetyl-CoA carboxylase carboxyltransferase component
MTWQPELDELRRRQELAERMGGPEKIRRQRDAGRLTVRERIAALLDEGSFHEIGALAGTAGYDESGKLASFIPANFVTGTGRLDGRKVVVGGDDFTVRGGAADASIIGKQIYAEQLANELHLPIIRLVEGTGGGGSVKTLEQSGHTYVPVNPGWDYVVDNLSMVPVVAAGLGPVAGLGAARLCAAHLSILVEGTAQLFVAGPPVVSSGVGEHVDKEQLGGSRVHARNGAVDLIAAAERLRVAAGRGERRPGQPAGGRAARGCAARSAPALPDPPDPGCRLRRRLGHGSPALRRLDRDGAGPAGRPSGRRGRR